MVIDVHHHWEPDLGLDAFTVPLMLYMCKRMHCPLPDPNEVDRLWRYYSHDPTGERIVSLLDEDGVDKTVLFCWDRPGFTDEQTMEVNKTISDIGRRFPDRIIPFATVNPTREKACDMLKKCVEEYGLVGVKWHCENVPFIPSDKKNRPFLKVVDDYKLTIVTHCGAPIGSFYNHPLLLDGIMADFPHINIIAAHAGWRWWPDLAGVMEMRNEAPGTEGCMYGCLTEWQLMAVGNYPKFCRTLRDMIDDMGKEYILWGTDSPFFNTLLSDKDWIALIRNLPNDAPEDIRFTQEEVDAILGGNAQRLFKL
jgi:predicted TIM-barrel fold metal-dependent hydrolase